MHELGITKKIVEAAEKAAKENDINHVVTVRLRLGKMAAAHHDQLQFGFQTYAKGSRLDGAKFLIEDVDVLLKCEKCGNEFNDEQFNDEDFAHTIAHAPMAYSPPPCPKCGSSETKVLHGKEMELVGLEGE